MNLSTATSHALEAQERQVATQLEGLQGPVVESEKRRDALREILRANGSPPRTSFASEGLSEAIIEVLRRIGSEKPAQVGKGDEGQGIP